MSEVPKKQVKIVKQNISYGTSSFDLSKVKKPKIKPVKRTLITSPSFAIKKDPTRKIFISSDEFNGLSVKDKKEALKRIFLHYRKNGFPYPEFTDRQIQAEMYKLKLLDTDTLLAPNNIIKRNKIGLAVANAYMPHMYGIRSHNFTTPMEAFEDTKIFLRAIKKAIDFNGGVRDSTIRSSLKWVTGTQMVSNFRPTVAKYIYDHYAGSGRVLDFSCGYGGRLIGAISSNRVHTYAGTDPCVPTYKQLLKIKKDLGEDKRIKIKNEPFEDAKFKKNSFDLAFSSPPYFHQEEYGDEEGQSFNRYPTKEKWRDGFLSPLIKNCFRYLKDDGHFILNIANIETYKTFEEDALKLAERTGFVLEKTYLMALSKLFTSTAFKFEPIFCFKKK
jgi:SAM-dependent methyltransferase